MEASTPDRSEATRVRGTGAAAVLRGLLDEARDGLLALDANGTITHANAAAADILRHERSRLTGKPLAALVALADRRRFRAALARAASDGETLQLRLHADPEPWTVVLRALPGVSPRTVVASLTRERPFDRIERFALQFPFGVVAVRSDLGIAFANGRARALLGDESVRTGGRLGEGLPPDLRTIAHRLTEMPAPLHSTLVELRDGTVLRVSGVAANGDDPAIMLLEDATEERQHERVTREFLRNAAHQLRTPLAGITAAIETLQAGAKHRPEERDRFLAHLEKHADRLTRIARGLLVLARAQTGEQPRVDFVELRPLLEQVVASVEPREGVSVHLDCDRALGALASPELLQEALTAIVENAVEHTGEGEVRLTAAAHDGRVALSVIDSGGGILPEFRQRVFEPFFRVGDAGTGYGLGLAIAAQAVNAMDGEIDVSDAPGGGTTFVVKLRSPTVVL